MEVLREDTLNWYTLYDVWKYLRYIGRLKIIFCLKFATVFVPFWLLFILVFKLTQLLFFNLNNFSHILSHNAGSSPGFLLYMTSTARYIQVKNLANAYTINSCFKQKTTFASI